MRIVLTLALRSKRDVLLARQRARQTAVLFHFEPHDQACIAAGAFAVAAEALRRSKCGQLWIQIEDRTLRIFSREGRAKPSAPSLKDQNERGLGVVSLQLLKALPTAAADFSAIFAAACIFSMILRYSSYLSGGIWRSCSSTSLNVFSHIGVWTAPGSIMDTMIPHRFSSMRSTSVIASIAALDAL